MDDYTGKWVIVKNDVIDPYNLQLGRATELFRKGERVFCLEKFVKREVITSFSASLGTFSSGYASSSPFHSVQYSEVEIVYYKCANHKFIGEVREFDLNPYTIDYCIEFITKEVQNVRRDG